VSAYATIYNRENRRGNSFPALEEVQNHYKCARQDPTRLVMSFSAIFTTSTESSPAKETIAPLEVHPASCDCSILLPLRRSCMSVHVDSHTQPTKRLVGGTSDSKYRMLCTYPLTPSEKSGVQEVWPCNSRILGDKGKDTSDN
jgi:hypothetical protein